MDPTYDDFLKMANRVVKETVDNNESRGIDDGDDVSQYSGVGDAVSQYSDVGDAVSQYSGVGDDVKGDSPEEDLNTEAESMTQYFRNVAEYFGDDDEECDDGQQQEFEVDDDVMMVDVSGDDVTLRPDTEALAGTMDGIREGFLFFCILLRKELIERKYAVNEARFGTIAKEIWLKMASEERKVFIEGAMRQRMCETPSATPRKAQTPRPKPRAKPVPCPRKRCATIAKTRAKSPLANTRARSPVAKTRARSPAAKPRARSPVAPTAAAKGAKPRVVEEDDESEEDEEEDEEMETEEDVSTEEEDGEQDQKEDTDEEEDEEEESSEDDN